MTEAVARTHGASDTRTVSTSPRHSARLPRAPAYVLWLVIVFLVLEYIRPPLVAQLKLQFLFLEWCAKPIPVASNNFARPS